MTRVIDQELHKKLDGIIYSFNYRANMAVTRANRNLQDLRQDTLVKVLYIAEDLRPRPKAARALLGLARQFEEVAEIAKRFGAAFEDCNWEEATDKPVKVAP